MENGHISGPVCLPPLAHDEAPNTCRGPQKALSVLLAITRYPRNNKSMVVCTHVKVTATGVDKANTCAA